jgi:hypothetical protein
MGTSWCSDERQIVNESRNNDADDEFEEDSNE